MYNIYAHLDVRGVPYPLLIAIASSSIARNCAVESLTIGMVKLEKSDRVSLIIELWLRFVYKE